MKFDRSTKALFGLHLSCFCVFISALEEGSSCLNFDGSSGVCVLARSCKWALDNLQLKKITASQFVQCGFQGTNSIICCKDEAQASEATRMPTTDQPRQPPHLRKSDEACEIIKKIRIPDLSFHIINGQGADVGEFPHMAAIGYADEVDATSFYFDCGGSLISQNFVLTAANCVDNKNRQPKIIRLGRVSLVEDEGDPNQSQDLIVKTINVHPNYTSSRKYDDIALIEMETTVQVMKSVKPACLFTKRASFYRTQQLEITGWGRVSISTNARSNWLMKANISEITLEKCRTIYRGLSQLVSQLPDNLQRTQLCASQTVEGNIIGPCDGDEGSPIQFRKRISHDDVFFIVGVSSFTVSCGSDIPGVYTKVTEYLDWIEQVVWPGAFKMF